MLQAEKLVDAGLVDAGLVDVGLIDEGNGVVGARFDARGALTFWHHQHAGFADELFCYRACNESLDCLDVGKRLMSQGAGA